MTIPCPNVGALVLGAPTSPRALCRHAELLAAYADGDLDDGREAYLSHYVYGDEMQRHYSANRRSVAGFAGPAWCRWLALDIDRPDLAAALDDARRLVVAIGRRYPELDPPVYFSGSKGYHVLIDLAHSPPPSPAFPRVARAFAEALATRDGVVIDTGIYDIAHIVRLPNSRHPRSGLFKRPIHGDALFRLDAGRILDLARQPSGDGLPPPPRKVPAALADDWHAAERAVAVAAEARVATRREAGPADARAPRYFLDLLRFGVEAGERHQTLFRCAAWLTEQGAPPSLCAALLTEAGCDVGLSPADVARQIRCGIDHAARQRGAMPADPDAAERWAIEHEGDPLPPDAMAFPFGALAPSAEGPA